MAVDPAFGKNSFNKPKFYNESQTIANNIMTILLGRPGFYPSMPELGMDIRNMLYKPLDEINPDAIKAKLVQQCSQFMTAVRNGTFDVQIIAYKGRPMLIFIIPVTVDQSNKRLAIGITTNQEGKLMYQVEYNPETIDA
jgi:hypothetical protein